MQALCLRFSFSELRRWFFFNDAYGGSELRFSLLVLRYIWSEPPRCARSLDPPRVGLRSPTYEELWSHWFDLYRSMLTPNIVACCWPTALMWLIPFIRSTSIRKSQGKVYLWGRDLWLCARRTNPLNSDGSSKIVIERKTRSGAKDVSVQKNSKSYMLIRIIVEVKHRFDV